MHLLPTYPTSNHERALQGCLVRAVTGSSWPTATEWVCAAGVDPLLTLVTDSINAVKTRD
jgi:hypothetical protein